MAHQFPTTNDNRRRKVSDDLFRNLPLIQARNQHSAAVESGNWGLIKTANTILTMLKDLPKSSTPLRQLSSLSLFLENNLADWYLLITFATILNNLKQQRLWNYLLDFGLERK